MSDRVGELEAQLAKAVAAVREAEARFRTLSEAMPQIVWVANEDGSDEYLNARWFEYTGQSIADALGHGWMEAIHPNDRERLMERWQLVVATGEMLEITYRLRRHDGEYRWFLARSSPLRESAAKAQRWIGTSTDVHAQLVLAEELQASEQRLALALDAAGMVASTVDLDLRYTWVRNARYPASRVLGKRDDEFLPLEYAEPAMQFKREVLAAGTRLTRAVRAPGALGDRWFEVSAEPARDADGRITGLVMTGRDVTEERRAAEALQASESRLRRIFESGMIGLIFWKSTGEIVDANDRLLQIIGYTRDDLEAGRIDWRALTPPQWLHLDEKALVEIAATGTCTPFEKEYVHKKGHVVPVMLGGAAVDGDSGVGFVLDITDRKRIERELQRTVEREKVARQEAERANRAKDEFLATLSHELRTPMTSILGWTGMLIGRMLDEESVPTAMKAIHDAARLQAQLIDDLLDVSRAAAGKLGLELVTTDVVAVVARATEAVRVAAQERRQTIDLRIDIATAPVVGDAKRLQQVVSNLLSNAIKFSHDGGRIDVHVREVGDEITIAVRDEGKGIDPEFLPRVFERFTQQDATSTRTHGGLGLGLAIVRQLVELHGGRVEAHSDGIGRGAEFRVFLPRSAQRMATPAAAPRRELPSLAGVHVLLVDDDEAARQFLESAVSSCGARTASAASAAEAVAAYDHHPPDVVISDIAMPGEDGLTLIGRIRKRDEARGRRTAALAVSALGFEHERARILAAGFDEYLRKPVDAVTLARAVAALVR